MKNKGFTLVELLVTIVILGIITGISIPLIRNVQSTMTEKKYTTYYNGLKTSAKLYNDSYSEDLFGNSRIGVACIKYSDLEKRRLIKDINIENVTCDKEKTFVRVTKIEDKYVYSPYLECGKKDEEESDIYMPKDNKEREISLDFCKIEDNATILITADLSQTNGSANKKRKKTKVTLASYTGIYNDVNIKAQWVKENEEIDEKKFEPLTFKIKGNQKETLLKEGIVTTTSKEIVTPQGGNGKYYLVLEVNKLVDLYGREWKNNKPEDGKYVKLGPFIVDNQKPTIENLKVISTNKNYNAIDTKVEFTGTDNLTPQNNLRMCIKEGSYCTNYKKYAQSTALKLSGGYDGKERTIYVTLIDLAGNVRQTTVKYKVAITHKLTYSSNGGSACSETSKSITHNSGDNTKWGSLCTPKKTGYTFGGWKNGNTTVTKDTVVNGNITVKASWTANKYTVTFNANGGSVSPTSKQVTYDSTYGNLPTPTRSGYIFTGWYTSGGFDANYYSNTYKDLKNAFGTNYQKLINHWVKYGMNEERNSSSNYRKAKDIYKVEGNQTLIAGWIRYGEDSSCGCHEYNSCEACGCAEYNSCKTAACGTTTTTTKVYANIWVLQGYCSAVTSANGYTWYAVRPGSQAVVDCSSAIGNKTNQGCCKYYRNKKTTTTKECRDSSCGCASYNSCSSCGCKTYNTCYY